MVLEYPSHTATDNLLMAAVLAKGTTVIENAAREPEISDLAAFLGAMGATIRGAGTSRIEVEGVDELHPADHTVVADRVVAATYLAAVGLAGGEVVMEDARPDHMEMLLRKLATMGVRIDAGARGAAGRGADAGCGRPTWPRCPTRGWPPTTSPLLVAMLAVADGVGIVTENLFSGRFRYVDELRRMGADIRTEGHHAVVRGRAPALGRPGAGPGHPGRGRPGAGRAGGRGRDRGAGAHHVDRGYEDLAGALRSLGASACTRR